MNYERVLKTGRENSRGHYQWIYLRVRAHERDGAYVLPVYALTCSPLPLNSRLVTANRLLHAPFFHFIETRDSILRAIKAEH